MEPRKNCQTCGKYLISFCGHYLHPDTLCNGVKDCIDIEAEVTDKFLNDKFKQLYGTPKTDDYERVTILEKHKEVLVKQIKEQNKVTQHPIVRFLIRFLKI